MPPPLAAPRGVRTPLLTESSIFRRRGVCASLKLDGDAPFDRKSNHGARARRSVDLFFRLCSAARRSRNGIALSRLRSSVKETVRFRMSQCAFRSNAQTCLVKRQLTAAFIAAEKPAKLITYTEFHFTSRKLSRKSPLSLLPYLTGGPFSYKSQIRKEICRSRRTWIDVSSTYL